MASEVFANVDVLANTPSRKKRGPGPPTAATEKRGPRRPKGTTAAAHPQRGPDRARSAEKVPVSASKRDEVRISRAARKMEAGRRNASHDRAPHTVIPWAFVRANENSNARDALRALVGRTPIVLPSPTIAPEPEPGAEVDPNQDNVVTPATPEENSDQETGSTPVENPTDDTAPAPVEGNQTEADQPQTVSPEPVPSSEPQPIPFSAPAPLTESTESEPQPTFTVSSSGSFVRYVSLRGNVVTPPNPEENPDQGTGSTLVEAAENSTDDTAPAPVEGNQTEADQPQTASPQPEAVPFSEPAPVTESTESEPQPTFTVGSSGSFVRYVNLRES